MEIKLQSLEKQDLEVALAEYNAVIQEYPDSAQNFLYRGLIHKELGDYNEAYDDFTTAYNLEASFFALWYRGIVKLRESKHDAFNDINIALNTYNPTDGPTDFFEGNSEPEASILKTLYREFGEVAEEFPDLGGLIHLWTAEFKYANPNLPFHERLNATIKALKIARENKNKEHLRISEELLWGYNLDSFYTGDIFVHEIADLKILISSFSELINIYPDKTELYFFRAILKSLAKQDYNGSIEDLNHYIKLYPREVSAYYNRGEVKFLQKDYKGAIDDLNKVIEMDPNDATAFYNRGEVKKMLQDFEGAELDIQHAIKIEPLGSFDRWHNPNEIYPRALTIEG